MQLYTEALRAQFSAVSRWSLQIECSGNRLRIRVVEIERFGWSSWDGPDCSQVGDVETSGHGTLATD